MTAAAMRPQIWKSLGFRMAFALAVALLPLGVVSAMQSRSLLIEAQARSQAALLGETLLAAAPEAGLFRAARSSASTLAAAMAALSNDPVGCQVAMRRVIDEAAGIYSFAAFVPLSGDARCTSNGKPLDLSKSERLARVKLDPAPDVVVIRKAIASGTSVLAFGHPAYDIMGKLLGYVSISLPHKVLETRSALISEYGSLNTLEPLALITFDRNGNILTSSTGLDDAPTRLPVNRSLKELGKLSARTFTDSSGDGARRVYAVFPLIEGKIFAIGSWPIAFAGPVSLSVSPYLLPALMWLVSLLTAVAAAEWLVTRHIRVLRRSITAFAAGNRMVGELDLPTSTTEIRDVGNAYLAMTDTILHDEAKLEDVLHQREVLLREVHHRVKNNLQLISSIMNLQMRRAYSPEAKTMLKSLQDRVMSLATIHRELYQTSGLTDVRADELLADIVRQIVNLSSGPGRRFDVTTEFADLRITPDQAVPLSLLMTEALTNALKYAGSMDGSPATLKVSLRRLAGEQTELAVVNSLGPQVEADLDMRDKSTGLGSQLMAAFSQQISAQTVTSKTATEFSMRVLFNLRSAVDGVVDFADDDVAQSAKPVGQV